MSNKAIGMTIGDLIAALCLLDCSEDAQVFFDFPYVYPTTIGSWRGVYAEAALGYAVANYGETKNAPTIPCFIKMLKESLGKTHTGWKGGEFMFNRDSVIHVDNPGCANEYVITSVALNRVGDVALTVSEVDVYGQWQL